MTGPAKFYPRPRDVSPRCCDLIADIIRALRMLDDQSAEAMAFACFLVYRSEFEALNGQDVPPVEMAVNHGPGALRFIPTIVDALGPRPDDADALYDRGTAAFYAGANELALMPDPYRRDALVNKINHPALSKAVPQIVEWHRFFEEEVIMTRKH